MHEPPYYTNYSKWRLAIHNVVTSKYFDLAIAAVIGLNVVTMALEFYMMPRALTYALKIFNYFFTAVFILESFMKLLALGLHLYLKDKFVYKHINSVSLFSAIYFIYYITNTLYTQLRAFSDDFVISCALLAGGISWTSASSYSRWSVSCSRSSSPKSFQ